MTQGRKALFLASREDGNAMDFVIRAELYDHLEQVVDRFEDVSNEINALVDRSSLSRPDAQWMQVSACLS